MARRIVSHRPVPGPMYWDWRCLRCGKEVDRHMYWWQRLAKLLTDPPPTEEVTGE